MELNTIQTEGTWNEVAEALNDNFSKIGVAIKSGTGGGGEGGSVSEELVEQIAENTSNILSNKTKINQLQNQVTVLNSNDSTNGSVRNLIKSALQDYVSEEALEAKGYTSQQDVNNTVDGYLKNYPTRTEVNESLSSKQDYIDNLTTIEANAALGATAVQPESLAKVATSGSYNDLKNKPTIPSAVTESTVSGWGFTKNTGTYSKPSGGIPASDLETSVQASLHKADAAVQQNDIYSKTELDTKFNNKIDKSGGEIGGSLVHIVSSTGGDAVGYEYKTKDGERIAGFGAYSQKGVLVHTFIGFGKEPWGTYNGLNVGENTFTYKGKAIWYSGQEITESVKISTGSDNKIVLNNTDGDTKYSFILFMDKGEEYGRLGTNGTSELRWNNNIIIDSNNYTAYVFTKDEVNDAIDQRVGNLTREYYTKDEAENKFAYKADVEGKQDKLRSGDNIATINGQSLLDGGNINIGNNGVTDVLKVSLDVSSFDRDEPFSITDAQLNAIIQSRSGYTVVVKDVNNNSNFSDNEWGQVIGCYFLNIGGGVTFYRITIMHHTNNPESTSGDMVLYNIDVMIQPGSSNHECTVISVKTL